MKKRKPASLYPEKEDITLKNFIIEDKNLLILLVLIVFIFLFIIGCLLSIPAFQAEHTYNYLIR